MTRAANTKSKRQAFYLRSFVSLFLVSSVLAEFVSGVVLYFAPSGRVAETMRWELLWLNKTQWEAMHTVFSFLWIPPLAIHLYFNWRPILAYLKDRVTKAYAFKRELVAALALTLFFTFASVYNWAPVSQVMAFGESMTTFWENRGRAAGYFLPAETVLHPETATAAQTPTTAAAPNTPALAQPNTTPSTTGANATASTTQTEGTGTLKRGFGKYTVQSLAEEKGIALDTALKRLSDKGIQAKPDETLLALSGRSGVLPSGLAALIEGIAPVSTTHTPQ